jgi:hypothetical protein
MTALLRRSTLVPAALGILLLLGHICALPANAMSSIVETTGSGEPGDHHDAHGSHVASCEATVSNAVHAGPPPTSAASVVVTGGTRAQHVALPSRAAAATRIAPRRSPDRAAFLLNASFLI